MASERASQQALLGVSALLFAASAAVTVVWCASGSAMGEMPMPGGWTMSMAWMRVPGQTWPGAAASFLGMWVVMMVAMMLPSLVPMLWRYREAVGGAGETRLGPLTALVGVGYFFVWTVFGMAAFPPGVALVAIEMQQPALARAVPIAVGVVVLIAGSLQLTAWKARHLACCREAPGRRRTLPADAGTAWRHGLRLGLHCSHCWAGLMAILLVICDSQRSPLPNVARGFLRCQRQFSPIPAPGAGTLGLVAAIRWILIVDDDADVRELWSDTLTRGGYRILTARHGRDALALMSAVVPDVIVLDLRMPEMTGSEFLQALRRSPAGRRIPVLIVSGYLEDAAPLSVAGLNVIGRLPKPLSLADLLAALPGASPPQR